jgi:hypothetical protein
VLLGSRTYLALRFSGAGSTLRLTATPHPQNFGPSFQVELERADATAGPNGGRLGPAAGPYELPGGDAGGDLFVVVETPDGSGATQNDPACNVPFQNSVYLERIEVLTP